MNKLLILSLAVLTVFLSSCLRREKPLEISLEVPEEIADDGEAVYEAMPQRWWLQFGDSRLNSLISAALSENLTLKQMAERVEQARLQAKIAGANLLPSADVSATASRERQTAGGAVKNTYSSVYSTSFFVNYELDLWGRVSAAAAAGVYQWQASGQDFEAAKISTAAEIAKGWFALIESKKRLQIIDKQIEIYTDTLDIIRTQFRMGKAAAADVFQQEELLESAKGFKADTQASIEVFRNQLAILSGKPANDFEVSASGTLPALTQKAKTALVTDLISRRPDIQSAYLNVKAYDRRAAQAIADRLPRITLSAAATTTDSQIKGLFDSWQSNIAAEITSPVFDAGAKKAEAERQKSLKKEAVLNYTQTVYQAVKEVADALTREKQQAKYVESLEKQLSLSRKSTQRIKETYIKGQTNFQRLLSAQLSLQQLKLSLVTAKRELLGYRIDLCKALAGKTGSQQL